MWILVVIFIATGGSFTVPGYSSQQTCQAAANEIRQDIQREMNATGLGGVPFLVTLCRRPD